MTRPARSLAALFSGLTALGATLLAPAEARADVDVEAHVALDLQADPGGLFYAATPPVRIVSPPRLTVVLTQGSVVATRVVGMQVVVVDDVRRPVVYVGHHHHARPLVYVVDHPRWVTAPGVVVVAPSPVVVGPPAVVVGAPGVYVVGPRFKGKHHYGHGGRRR
jgi:hypothetical protein